LEEMARKMEEMSFELSKLRLEKHKWNIPQEGNQNTNKYIRPYNSQIMQRDKTNNDDKKIQTPLQINYIEENQDVEEVDEDLDINLVGDEIALSHLTQNEYEYSLNAQAGESPYNMLCNTYQQGYNLRSKSAPAKSVPQKDKFAPTKPAP
jgi:hypothetical protein